MIIKTAIYRVRVDYGRSHIDQLEAGKFDDTTPYEGALIENEPEHIRMSSKEYLVRDVLVATPHFNHMSLRDISREFVDRGFRHAAFPEGIGLVEVHPNLQRVGVLVGVGSEWKDASGDKLFYYFDDRSGRRRVGIDFFHEGFWPEYYSFLGVRKSEDV